MESTRNELKIFILFQLNKKGYVNVMWKVNM